MIYDYIQIQKLGSFVLVAVKAHDSLYCLRKYLCHHFKRLAGAVAQ